MKTKISRCDNCRTIKPVGGTTEHMNEFFNHPEDLCQLCAVSMISDPRNYEVAKITQNLAAMLNVIRKEQK